MKNENDNEIDPFKVYVRVRPLLEKEMTGESEKFKIKSAVTVDNNSIYVVDPESVELYGRREKCFSFDDVFKEKENNNLIFERIVKGLVENIMKGYNSTALAYGVTGTGKTHTMFGDIYLNLNFEKGLCMFAVDHLFDRINCEDGSEYKVKINYLEIYNEQVIDLLTDRSINTNDQHLMIIEDPVRGTSVPDLTEYIVSSSEQVTNLIILGNSRRTMAPTGANQFSSRSHAILQINVEQRSKSKEKEEFLSSKLLLVDLAGSERGSLEKGIRREEGSNINKSLLALGNCINILSDKTKKGSFVPYRDSKLTRLLKDSLGGNIQTIMIACISPAAISYDETINTLNYASRARKIQKKVTKNIKEIDPYGAQYRELIENLKSEIVQLKEIINNQNILLRNRPIESFREDREFINLNLNLNLNINNNCNVNNNNHQNALSVSPFNTAIFNNNNIPDDEMMDSGLIKSNFNFFDLRRRSEQTPITPDYKDIAKNDFNFENCEDFLNKNLNAFTDNDFEDFEKKLEGLYFDKISLEDKILKGVKDSTLNEKYTIIKSFYEKYIELLNEKMIENIEQNMILKFNLKEILELNNINNNNLDMINEQLKIGELVTDQDEDYKKLMQEKENIEKNIEDNEKEKENISFNLEKNMKVKTILKKLLFKFLSNTQMKEMKDLQQAFTGVVNDKRELEVKNKKYQEFLNTVLKEKEEKDLKILEMSKDMEKMRRRLVEKEKRAVDQEKRIRELEGIVKEQKKSLKQANAEVDRYLGGKRKGLRSITVKRRMFYDDMELRTHSTRKFMKDKFKNILQSVNLGEYNSNTNPLAISQPIKSCTNSNNNITINLFSKIPRVTAVLHEDFEIIENPPEVNHLTNNLMGLNSTFNNLKNNLNKKSNRNRSHSKSPPRNKKAEIDRLVENHLNSKYNIGLVKNSSYKSKGSKKNLIGLGVSNKIQKEYQNKLDPFESNNVNMNNITNQNRKNTDNKDNKDNKDKKETDTISISAVTFNNEACLNSSELEIMENVLNLDGIKNKNSPYEREKMLTPLGKVVDTRRLLMLKTPNVGSTNNNNFQNYNHSFIRSREKGTQISKTRQATPVNFDFSVLQDKEAPLKKGHIRQVSQKIERDDDIFQNALEKLKEHSENLNN